MFQLFSKKFNASMSKEDIAKLLQQSPEALEAFEKAYAAAPITSTDDLTRFNVKEASSSLTEFVPGSPEAEKMINELVDRIVDELLEQTSICCYDGQTVFDVSFKGISKLPSLTCADIMAIPEEIRPMLTGNMMCIDVDKNSSSVICMQLSGYLKSKDKKKKKWFYDHFRQGLDILDLDPVTYAIIKKNQNSISNWFPHVVKGVQETKFFKIPKTKIMRVPMQVLQLTRIGMEKWNPTTISIVNRFCHKAFDLDDKKDYFIKTGTFSSKYDFRNAHVHEEKEVQELGEYLLFIHHQACQFASPLNNVVSYGAGTTTDWVVREYIEPPDNYPTIYHGLPLRTEYRAFIDGDDGCVIGISPYWKPDVMKKRFGHSKDSDDPDMVHDYISYMAAETDLMKRYEENKEKVVRELNRIIPHMGIHGQWSLDIMQNGDDFYIIDMSVAGDSALIECVPTHLLKVKEENWIPVIEMEEK